MSFLYLEKNIKTTIFTKEYGKNNYGGAGTHVTALADSLKNHISVDVKYFDGALSLQDSFRHWPQNLSSVSDMLIENINLLSGFDLSTDIVHCHTWYSFLSGILAKKILGKKCVATFHSVEKCRQWKKEQLGSAYEYSCWIEQTMCDHADKIIAVSNACKKDIIEAYNISDNKVEVIPNGVDRSCFNSNVPYEKICLNFGIDLHKPTILTASRITKQKGIDYLLDVLKYLDEDWQVVLVLNSADTKSLENEIKRSLNSLSKTKNIIWISDKIPINVLAGLYNKADLFISTAQYEPFGLTVAESICCGTPVIARATGGICEVLANNSAGQLCPINMPPQDFSNLINLFLLDSNKTTQKVIKQEIDSQILNWEEVAKLTYQCYKGILE